MSYSDRGSVDKLSDYSARGTAFESPLRQLFLDI